MPNGKPGDHPITDMLVHRKHPFPRDMEAMIREIYAIDPRILDELQWEPFEWEKGERLQKGRETLRRLLAKHPR